LVLSCLCESMAGTTPKDADMRAEMAGLGEKVDSLADSVTKLAQVVAEDRKANIENTKAIYEDLKTIRDRQANTGRITWPVIVSTVSAMFGLATILAGLGTYALRSESSVLASKIEGSTGTLNQRVEFAAARNERQDAELDRMREQITDVRIQAAVVRQQISPNPTPKP